ncbi:MAG TPA: response regulator, partial [Bacteroidia bacterium]|nr:response regulator [Bacteroidia bacterium]
NILLIEDNPADSRLIELYLKETYGQSFTLVKTESLSDGLEALKKQKFSVIIIDLSLPDSSGLETFQGVYDHSPETPIIVLTGHYDDSVGMNAMKLGAQDFLIKGKIRSKGLRRSISYSIERAKLLKALSENSKKLEEQAQDLIREKQKLSEAQKLAHIGSWEWNLEKNTVTWSDEMRDIFDLPSEVRQAAFEDIVNRIHPEDREVMRKAVEEALQTHNALNIHQRIVREDNSIRTLHTRGEVIRDRTGKPMLMVGTSQDVTERLHEENLEKLVLAATKSYNSVLILDKEGKIEWVNEGFTKLCGYTLEDVIGSYGEKVKNGIQSDIEEQRHYYERVLKHKAPMTYENKNFTSKGIGYWVITTLTPVLGSDGEVERIIAIDSDITLRKQMEEELLTANKIAEHSLMKGNKALLELTIAKKQLEESMKVKEKFLANMSHEIRTPMNAIVGFTNLLLKSGYNTEQGQYINAIKTSGENLLVIINDILDFSKIQSGKINFEQIDLRISQLISTLVELMLPKSVEKNIKLSSKIDKRIPEYLTGDPTRLNQILLNLVGNAIKFTEKGEVRIDVDLISETAQDMSIKFSVIDTGIGIPESKQLNIFEGFSQATDDTTRKYGGTGLGLTIVKQLVELQGGTIAVKSQEGKGSEFTVIMKFSKNSGVKMQSNGTGGLHVEEDQSLEGLSVLLVEDNYLNQVLATKVLTDWKWKVVVAENGLVALEKLEQGNFDVVLMDIQLPEMDGYEATRTIRSKTNKELAQIPIIAMTAHAINGEADKCYLAGMNDYVSKPFDTRVLYSKIAGAIKNKKTMNAMNQEPQPNNIENSGTKLTDLAYLRELANGSDEFIQNMISLFIQQTPEAIDKMESSLKQRDWKSVRAAAHKMKPSFSFMGIKQLKETIEKTEEYAGAEKELDKIPALIAEIKQVCDKALIELRAEQKVA